MIKTWLSWSSGKDCAWALHVLRQQGEVEVAGLLTTFNGVANRVAMHAVRRALVEEQARLAGVPLRAFDLPWPCSNAEYQERMARACEIAMAEGVECIAFGDLFLEDVRAYREEQLKATCLRPLFPIWGIPTAELAREMCAAGVRAKITCVDPRQLGREFAGRDWNEAAAEFPASVDVCGERGEFHTFAYAGPMFERAMVVETGEIVERDGFVFADVSGLLVRKARVEDALAVAQLSGELGYPVSDREVAERLRDLPCVLVAELAERVVGWVDASIENHLAAGRYGQINGLVVSTGVRGRGIGGYLSRAAEEWMKESGATRCVVRSRATRLEAHRFYLGEGYSLDKTSAVFGKKLRCP